MEREILFIGRGKLFTRVGRENVLPLGEKPVSFGEGMLFMEGLFI